MSDHVVRDFDGGASRYDLLVALNPGYHRQLGSAATALAERLGDPSVPRRLLDLGCGSGASTRAMLGVLPDARIVGIDSSRGMLARATAKRWPSSVQFRHGWAGHLAGQPDLAGADGAMAAYLFRNVPAGQRDAALADTRAALRSGGWLVVQDYCLLNARWRAVWHLVCWSIIIPLSVLTGSNPHLYRYLWRSVLDFDDADGFAARLHRAGFRDVASRPATGWQRGLLRTFVARAAG